MHIKATIMTYGFLVQCFENTTIVAYAGLRIKTVVPLKTKEQNYNNIICVAMWLLVTYGTAHM